MEVIYVEPLYNNDAIAKNLIKELKRLGLSYNDLLDIIHEMKVYLSMLND